MDREALETLYRLASENGYTKSIDDFQVLLNENEEARKTMYDLSVGEGYTKSLEDFTELVTPSKKKIEERIKERESALNSDIIFSESYETEDANPIFSALNEGWRQGRLVEALSPILGDISDISDEELDYLIETNNKLQSVPKSRQRKEYDEDEYDDEFSGSEMDDSELESFYNNISKYQIVDASSEMNSMKVDDADLSIT